MAGLLEFVGDMFGEAVGVTLLGPIVVGGVIISLASSPEARKRVRKWGVQGMAAALAAQDLATRGMKNATNGTGGMMSQIGHRVVQAAAEMREEWDDFIAEARTVKDGIAQPGDGSAREDDGSASRPRRRGARARRASR